MTRILIIIIAFTYSCLPPMPDSSPEAFKKAIQLDKLISRTIVIENNGVCIVCNWDRYNGCSFAQYASFHEIDCAKAKKFGFRFAE